MNRTITNSWLIKHQQRLAYSKGQLNFADLWLGVPSQGYHHAKYNGGVLFYKGLRFTSAKKLFEYYGYPMAAKKEFLQLIKSGCSVIYGISRTV